jgi:hypothetical protein
MHQRGIRKNMELKEQLSGMAHIECELWMLVLLEISFLHYSIHVMQDHNSEVNHDIEPRQNRNGQIHGPIRNSVDLHCRRLPL